ncbi:MAG: hypothetical protein HY606_14490 [Planctomycetes bacterium]|nr:hypothetical protein [Planctomycetota bacterium]
MQGSHLKRIKKNDFTLYYLQDFKEIADSITKLDKSFFESPKFKNRYVEKITSGKYELFIKVYGGYFNNFRIKREFSNLLRLSSLGIPCTPPIGYINLYGNLILITKRITTSITAKDFLRQENDFGKRIAFLNLLKSLINTLCVHGAYPEDFHMGNILYDNSHAYIVDANKLILSKSDDAKYSFLGNTVFSSHMLLSKTELLRLLKQHLNSGNLARIKQYFIRHSQKYALDRAKRTLKKGSSDFGLQNGIPMNNKYRLNFEKVCGDLSKMKPYKETSSATSYVTGKLFVKKFISHSKAKRCWLNAVTAKYLNINFIEPIALLKNIFISRYLKDAITLTEFIREKYTGLARKERSTSIISFANYLKSIYNRGVFHKDLKANNIIVNPNTGFFCLVDTEDIRLKKDVSTELMIKNLVQLNAASPGEFSKTDRLRLLKILSKSRVLKIPYDKSTIDLIMKETIRRRHVWPGKS